MSELPCFCIIKTLSGQICHVLQFISNPMFVLKEQANQKVFRHYLFLHPSMHFINVNIKLCLSCIYIFSMHSLRQWCVKCIWNLLWCLSHLYWCGLCPCGMLMLQTQGGRDVVLKASSLVWCFALLRNIHCSRQWAVQSKTVKSQSWPTAGLREREKTTETEKQMLARLRETVRDWWI